MIPKLNHFKLFLSKTGMPNRLVLIGTGIMSVIVFLYLSNFSQLYFLNDDNFYIPASKNLHFLYGTSYRPVSDLFLLIDNTLWGTHALGYHITSLLLHIIVSLLVFVLARQIVLKYDKEDHWIKAYLSALLFFFYPFHSEAVFWIIGRGGILGALFGTVSLIFFLKRDKSQWYLLFSIIFFLCGAFAYETSWIVPLIVLLIYWVEKKQFPAQKGKRKSIFIFWFIFLFYILIRTFIIGELGGSPYGGRAVIKFDLNLLVVNYNILIARSFLPPMQSITALFILYGVLIAGLVAGLVRLAIKKRCSLAILFCAACFLVSFLPILSLGVDSHDSESERFLYFPSVFAVVFLVELIWKNVDSSFIRTIFFGALLSAEIFYLADAARSYQVAGKIARASIESVSSLKKNTNLYCIDLPTQYRGGFIYRIGFKEAVTWLSKTKIQSVVIISQREIEKPGVNYGVQQLPFVKLPANERSDILNRIYPNQFIIGRDAVFKWTDSALFIFR